MLTHRNEETNDGKNAVEMENKKLKSFAQQIEYTEWSKLSNRVPLFSNTTRRMGFCFLLFSLAFGTQEVSEEKYGVNIVVSFFNLYFALMPAKLKSRKIVVEKMLWQRFYFASQNFLIFWGMFGKPKSCKNLKFSPNYFNAVCFKANGIHDKEDIIPCSKLILHLPILEARFPFGCRHHALQVHKIWTNWQRGNMNRFVLSMHLHF